jgi:hypothetical protein
MPWIYLPELVASHSHSKIGLDRLPTASETFTVFQSCLRECEVATSLLPRYAQMFASFRAVISERLTLSQPDSPARTSALQEMARAWKESEVDFSSRCVAWSKKSSPVSSSWKTCQPLELVVFLKSSTHLQLWGMTVGGRVSLPQKLEPRTLEKGGFYLPTPSSQMAGEGPLLESLTSKDGTPAKPGQRAYNPKTRKHVQVTLNRYVQMWPTPTSRDWKSGSMGTQGNSRPLSEEIGGQLNPMWVEWLMEFPLGWTELSPSAMQSFQRKPEKLLKD